jgi:DNA-binding PadR family transcriptional regulator
MHKELLILGFLGDGGPMTGYDLHRIVRAHGELFADLKKANMYYLLDRLAKNGYLRVRTEAGSPGPRGERLLYSLTLAGRRRFRRLLEEELQRIQTVHTGIEVAIVFLRQLPRARWRTLLVRRRTLLLAHRQRIAAAFGDLSQRAILTRIAADHLLSLIDAEIAWLERSLDAVERQPPASGENA